MYYRLLMCCVTLCVMAFRVELVLAQQAAGEFDLQDPANSKEVKVTLKGSLNSGCTLKYWSLGHTGIHATFDFANTTKETIYYAGFVALFDKDKNLVACLDCGSNRFSTLDPGKEIQEQINLALPLSELKRIRSYQVCVLIDNKEHGK